MAFFRGDMGTSHCSKEWDELRLWECCRCCTLYDTEQGLALHVTVCRNGNRPMIVGDLERLV